MVQESITFWKGDEYFLVMYFVNVNVVFMNMYTEIASMLSGFQLKKLVMLVFSAFEVTDTEYSWVYVSVSSQL